MAYAHRLKIQNDINTGYIISGRYKFKIQDEKELAKYIFADVEDEFHKRVKSGDFLVAGENQGNEMSEQIKQERDVQQSLQQ